MAEGGPPAIIINPKEIRDVHGESHSTPRDASGFCTNGTSFRFKVFIKSNNGIREITYKADGSVISERLGAIPLDDSRTSSHDGSEIETISFDVDVDAPLGSRRINNKSNINFTVKLIEENGYTTERSSTILVGPKPSYDLVQTRIDRPRSPAIFSSNANWQIAGHVQTDPVLGECGANLAGIKPERVELWHRSPSSGSPTRIKQVQIDSSGRFLFQITPQSIPIGNNVFNVQAILPVSVSSTRPDSAQSTLNATITPLKQDTVDSVNQPLPSNTRNQIPQSNLPGVNVEKSSGSADKAKGIATTPHNEKIQQDAIKNKSIKNKSIQGIDH